MAWAAPVLEEMFEQEVEYSPFGLKEYSVLQVMTFHQAMEAFFLLAALSYSWQDLLEHVY